MECPGGGAFAPRRRCPKRPSRRGFPQFDPTASSTTLLETQVRNQVRNPGRKPRSETQIRNPGPKAKSKTRASRRDFDPLDPAPSGFSWVHPGYGQSKVPHSGKVVRAAKRLSHYLIF